MLRMALLILGLGNDLLGDDGVGLLAADALMHSKVPSIEVTKSSLSGLYLVDLVEGYDDLIIVDSIAGTRPGKVTRLPLSKMGPKIVPSAHYLGLAEALDLAKRAGMSIPNRVEIVAMQIHETQTIGTGISKEVRAGLSSLLEEVRKVAKGWGYEFELDIPPKNPKKR